MIVMKIVIKNIIETATAAFPSLLRLIGIVVLRLFDGSTSNVTSRMIAMIASHRLMSSSFSGKERDMMSCLLGYRVVPCSSLLL